MDKGMKVVIDTNVLVSSLSSHSKYHWLILALLQEKFTLLLNHEILLEYEEVLMRKYSFSIAGHFLHALSELPNVEEVFVYYNWNLLHDADDNKFVDVYIAGKANYLITEDNDFKLLKQIDFPPVNVLGINDFEKLLS